MEEKYTIPKTIWRYVRRIVACAIAAYLGELVGKFCPKGYSIILLSVLVIGFLIGTIYALFSS